MNNRIIIVPDVHGREFWKPLLTADLSKVDKVVFLGDYLDPYGFEKISFADAVVGFREVLEFKKRNMEKVILLLGNHDMTYVMPEKFESSVRHNYMREAEMHQLFVENINLFQLFYDTQVNHKRYIFSHGGIHPWWKDEYLGYTVDEILKLYAQPILELPEFAVGALDIYSSLRGGYSQAGSPIWADVREYEGWTLDADYYQIFGHTQQLEEPVITSRYACLDCRKVFELRQQSPVPALLSCGC